MDRKPTYEELEKSVKQLREEIARRKGAEELLLENEEKFRTLTEQSPNMIFILNKKGQIVYANGKYKDIMGYTPDELCSPDFDFRSMIAPESLELSESSVNKHAEGKEVDSAEYTLVRKDGDLINTIVNSKLIDFDGDKAILGVVTDVTERKRTEETLRKSEIKHRTLMESVLDGVYTLDTEGRFTYVNDVILERSGRTREWFLGKGYLDVIREEDRDRVQKNFDSAMRGETVPIYELPYPTASGDLLWVEVNSTPIREDGRIIGLFGVSRDITDRKKAKADLQIAHDNLEQRVEERTAELMKINKLLKKEIEDREGAEKALRESEERLRLFMESATDTFSLYDSQLNFVDVNEASMDFFPPGTKKEDIIGTNVLEWAPVLKPSGRYDKYLEVIRTGRPFFSDDVVVDSRLGKKHVDVRAFRVGDGLGILATDITERKLAEEELRKSEKRYRTLFEMSPDVISTVSLEDGTITSLNPVFEKLTGWSRAELIGKPYTSIFHPDDIPIGIEQYQRLLSGEDLPPLELRILSKSGEEMFGEFITRPERKDGKVVSLVSFIRNITDHKRTEEALRKSEKKYRKLFEEITDAIIVADPDTGILTDCNRAALALVGRERSELVGKHQRILHPPEEIEGEFSRTFEQHMKEKEGEVLEAQVITKNGEIKDVAIGSNVLELEGKKLMQGMFRDITERKQAETALKKSQEKYRSILENMEEGYYEVDIAGNFTFFNDSMCKVLGYSKDELIDMNNRQVMDQDTAKIVYQTFNKVYNTGIADIATDWVVIRKDGTKKTVETSMSLMKDKEDRPIGFRGVARDISERKRMEKALRQREKELKIKSFNLEEVNSALRVLLKKRDEDKAEVEEKVLFNMEELVKPYLEKLKKTGSDERQQVYIEILESNLKDIVSPISHSLSSKYLKLTPTEIRVANLIKQGKTTKNIAAFLDVSHRTIEDHRKNIRKKLGLKNKKANLRTHLKSIQQ